MLRALGRVALTVNVLSICYTRETAGKLAGNILNVLMMYQMGICQVHCPCTYNVLTVYQVRTLGFVPSDWERDGDLGPEYDEVVE